MTININKELGSVSTIKFKGLGDPGPFSFTVLSGNLPTGTSLETLTGKLIGTFTTIGIFDFKIKVFKHDRIQAIEDVNIVVEKWNLVRTDFRSLVDESGTAWAPVSGSLTKVTDDPLLFDGQCYETTASGLAVSLAKPIGERDFELEFIFKPVNNGGTDAYSRYLMIGPNNTKGTFVFYRKVNTGQPRLSISHCPNDSNFVDITSTDPVLDPDAWNHVLFIKKRETISLYVNFVKIFSSSLKHNFSGTTLYLASSEANTQKFNCRVKKLSLRINDSKDYLNNKIVTDVFRFKIINKKTIFLSSLYHNSLAIETNYLGNFIVRVKENSSLPTGLSLINNKITGLSQLLDNKFVYLELVIQGVVHDTIELEILSLDRPNYILELPLTGELNNDVFGDTKSRQWIKKGNPTLIQDDLIINSNTSTYLDGSNSCLYLNDPEFIVGSSDVCYSFWFKMDEEPINPTKTLFSHGVYGVNGTILIEINSSDIMHLWCYDNSWIKMTANVADNLIFAKKNEYVFITVARKNNVWRFFKNNLLIVEITRVLNIVSDLLIVGNNTNYNSNLKGNIVDFKVSRDVLQFFNNVVVPNTVKQVSYCGVLSARVNTTLEMKIEFSDDWGDVKYLIDDTSSLPLGITLSHKGVFKGSPTAIFSSEILINCFINNLLNHTLKVLAYITDNTSDFLPLTLGDKVVINMDTDNITEDNNQSLYRWQSKNSRAVFEKGTIASAPQISSQKLNNFKIVSFENGEKCLYNETVKAMYKNVSSVWALVVFRKQFLDTNSTNRLIMRINTASGNERFSLASNYSPVNKFYNGYRRLDSHGWNNNTHDALLDTDWVIAVSLLDFESGKGYIYLNGTKQEFNLGSTGDIENTIPNKPISIGNHCNGTLSEGFAGDLVTLISGNTLLSENEIHKLTGWAAHKYNLTRLLPVNHLYKEMVPLIN